ncbi:PTS mannitol-specific IIC component [Thermoanaerobacterium thermosaccharolyticum]|uniref:PTS system mannitol-specific EIICB component n=1 Tax=Thermoanaerobacterium thermosaccharolyticum TaxID=1517 RepID=A0A223HZ20_THETR|nr:PTS mannitol transporter subunit IICB [Thermoanaerobacterium thermosaccharolyticum]AST57711.1 PTS mannitol-specific IIC component [Thermoanaerobacterium thermosaccharolyticum]
MSQNTSIRVRVQKYGTFLSGMVMPNIGAFIAWGFLTALFIPTGWLPNKLFANLVGPTLQYLMPILIGYTGGTMIHGRRGGVIGAIATMGVVVGAGIPMLAGGMLMGPLGAFVMKKVDKLFEGKVKPGMEMLVDNFSMGFVGLFLMLLGLVTVQPVLKVAMNFLSAGVQYLINAHLLPFTSIFVQTGDVLFLNNIINHGILVPLGVQQAAATGKSILFLVEANGSVWVGVALAFAMFGKGAAKKSAPAATIIMFFGGIAEVVFPYILSKPKTVLGPIVGNIAALFTLSILGGGTVAAVSPGSFIALLAMTPKGTFFANIAGYVVGLVVTCAVTGLLLTRDKSVDEEGSEEVNSTTSIPEMTTDATVVRSAGKIKTIVFACDAGMGSSVMGVSLMKNKLNKAMLEINVEHCAVKDIPESADIIITSKALEERVYDTIKKYNKSIPVFGVPNLLEDSEYDKIINYIKNSQYK